MEGGGEVVGIERGVDGVAGEGVIVGERKERGSGQAAAGAAEGDAGGGVAPEVEPRIAARSGGVDVGEGINA